MLRFGQSNILYASVLPHQQIWHPNNGQPWGNTQHDTIISEDGPGLTSRWVWLDLNFGSIDPDYRGSYVNLDFATSGLGIHALDGAIIEFYNSTKYDGCAATIYMVDWYPPSKWVPPWPSQSPVYPYPGPWGTQYFQSTGYTWEQYPNNTDTWGYWDPYVNDRHVGVHFSNHTPEILYGAYVILVRLW